MEILKFLSALYRRRFLLVIIPLATVIITYMLVRYLPDSYISKSDIATGITDHTQQLPGTPDAQESQINQEFNNLIQLVLLKKTIDQVSYQLIIHDLATDTPFRKPSKVLEEYTPEEKKEALTAFRKLYEERSEMTPTDKYRKKLYTLLKSMKYDDESLRGKITVYRVNTSDYIRIEAQAEDVNLAPYIANTLTNEFITSYTFMLKGNRLKTSDWLYRLLTEKMAAMQAKMVELKNYKIKNRVLNLDEQAKVVYGQIGDFETRRELNTRDMQGYTAVINSINNKFSATDRKYLEATQSQINNDILGSKAELARLNEAYIRSNFDGRFRKSIDSLRSIMEEQIKTASDKYIYNPMAAKANLVNEKITAEVQLDLARTNQSLITEELRRLESKLNGLVPHEAFVKDYETAIDVASREYLEILEKWNEFNLNGDASVKLKQVQAAIPGDAQPSKKMLLILLSAIISFVFCVAIIFVLYITDNSVQDARQLADRTGAPVLAPIELLKNGTLDLKQIWQHSGKDMQVFKNQLRMLRYELEAAMGDGKLLAITSVKAEEGKSFLAINMAYAWSMANKKVLLIDGNFGNPGTTNLIKPSVMLEDILTGKAALPVPQENGVVVIGNKGSDASLPEMAAKEVIQEKITALKALFDVIIVDTAAMEAMEKPKEWMPVTDSLVAVFEAGNPINSFVKPHIQYLTQQEQFVGWVLNKA